MRKVILEVAVSLDGFIEGPNGEYDWCFNDQDYGLTEFSKRIDAIFMGRKTYDMAKTMGGQRPWKGVTTYIFSNTLKSIENSDRFKLVRGDLKKNVEEVCAEKGKDIWLFGGASLTTSFINEQLVDEIRLAVHPILLGGG